MITNVQKEVHSQVKRMLAEHFDNYVLVLETHVINTDGEEACLWAGSFNGSNSTAVGLMEKYRQELVQQSISRPFVDRS